MAVAPSRIKAANEMALRAGALLEDAHDAGLRTAEEYAEYLNRRGLKRASGKPWDKAKVLQAVNRYRELGGTKDLLMLSAAMKRGWETRRRRNVAWDAKLIPVLENLHKYGVATSRRYALALNQKGIKSPCGKPWTEKSAWMLIDRYRKNGGKVDLIERAARRRGRQRRPVGMGE